MSNLEVQRGGGNDDDEDWLRIAVDAHIEPGEGTEKRDQLDAPARRVRRDVVANEDGVSGVGR